MTSKHGITAYHPNGAIDGLTVFIHDNTDDGLKPHEHYTFDDGKTIADAAIKQAVYWSDERARYWMFDFRAANHWCEMIDPEKTGAAYWDELHINVYA